MAQTLVQTRPEIVSRIRNTPPDVTMHPNLRSDIEGREHIYIISEAHYSSANVIPQASSGFRSCKALVLYDGIVGSLAHMWYDDDPAPYIRCMKRDLKRPQIQAIAIASPDEIPDMEQALLDQNISIKSLISLPDKPDKDILFTPLEKEVKIYRRGEIPIIEKFD